MEVLNTETFKTKIFDFEKNKDWVYKGNKPAIIDFYADWCAPCRALSPVLDALAKDFAGQIDIYKINTELTPDLASLFGIRGIPSLLFIPTTGSPTMSSGFVPREGLEKAIADLFKINNHLN